MPMGVFHSKAPSSSGIRELAPAIPRIFPRQELGGELCHQGSRGWRGDQSGGHATQQSASHHHPGQLQVQSGPLQTSGLQI